jgi:hypothetical protein
MSGNAPTPSIPGILAECYAEVYDPGRASLRKQYPHYYPLSLAQMLFAECYVLLRDDIPRHLTRQGETDADIIAEQLLTLGCAGDAKAVESILRPLANNPDPTLVNAVRAAMKEAIAAAYRLATLAAVPPAPTSNTPPAATTTGQSAGDGDGTKPPHVRPATQREYESDIRERGHGSSTGLYTFATAADKIRARITDLRVFWELCDNSHGAMVKPDYASDVDEIRNLYRNEIGRPPTIEWDRQENRTLRDIALDALDKLEQSLDESAPYRESAPAPISPLATCLWPSDLGYGAISARKIVLLTDGMLRAARLPENDPERDDRLTNFGVAFASSSSQENFFNNVKTVCHLLPELRSACKKSGVSLPCIWDLRAECVAELAATIGERGFAMYMTSTYTQSNAPAKLHVGGYLPLKGSDLSECRRRLQSLPLFDAAQLCQMIDDEIGVAAQLRVIGNQPISPAMPLRLHIDDIDTFKKVRDLPIGAEDSLLDKNGFLNKKEDEVQRAIAAIVREPFHKEDWGGEINDLYTTNIRIGSVRVPASFLLKGKGLKKKVMTLADCGKNGDQVVRLMDSPAELFFVQYVGPIDENVFRDLEGKIKLARAESRSASYCVINGQDTARLLLAYAS